MTGALFHGKESALFFKNGILFYFVPVRAAVAEYVNPASYLMNHIGIHPAESDIFIIFQMAYIFAPGVKKKGFAGVFRISRFSGLVYAGHVELVFNGPGLVQGWFLILGQAAGTKKRSTSIRASRRMSSGKRMS